MKLFKFCAGNKTEQIYFYTNTNSNSGKYIGNYIYFCEITNKIIYDSYIVEKTHLKQFYKEINIEIAPAIIKLEILKNL